MDAPRTQQVTELLSAKAAEHKRSVRWNLPGFKVYFWPLSETLQTPDPARKQILVIYALKVSKETPAETDSSAYVWLSQPRLYLRVRTDLCLPGWVWHLGQAAFVQGEQEPVLVEGLHNLLGQDTGLHIQAEGL